MAHRFDNFDDAFEEWSGWFASLKTLYATAGSQLFAAYDGCPDPVDRYHFYRMYAAIQTMRNMFVTLTNLTQSTWDRSSLYESVYWANKDASADYELTLINMIQAYIDAHDDHRSAHRLLLDAYQASMYDKPFDKEYHAGWIQRFRSWA